MTLIDLTKPTLVKCAGCGHWIEMSREAMKQIDSFVYPPGRSFADVRTFCDVCQGVGRKVLK